MRRWSLAVRIGSFVAIGFAAGCRDDVTKSARGWIESDQRGIDFGVSTLGVESRREVLVEQRGVLPVEAVTARVEPEGSDFFIERAPQRLAREGQGKR